MWLFSIQFVPCYLIYRSSILRFLFPRNVYSRIFFFHLCGTNNFQNEKSIYYTMSIDSQIYSRQKSIFPTMQPQFPARKRAIPEEKRKRRGEKKEKSAWPTVHEFVPLETRFRSLCRAISTCSTSSRGTRFLLCSIFSYFMGAPIKVLRE